MELYPIAIKTDSIHMNEDEFFRFCQDNPELKLERNANGDIIIMAPTGYETGSYNLELSYQVHHWNILNGRPGICIDSNTGITLPNAAVRSPDVSWISNERNDVLTKDDIKKFAHVCPDFLIELRSVSDNLETLKLKMQEYIDNGCRLGLLIDPMQKQVHVYQPGYLIIKAFSESITGEDVLPGLVLDLSFFK